MEILVTGATGMIGAALQQRLSGHRLWCLMRRPARPGELTHGMAIRSVDEVDAKIDAVINLAGENIGAGRWSASRKKLLRESRIDFTEKLISDLQSAGQTPAVWINASAVGYYGDSPGKALTEDSDPGSDFPAKLCADWEAVLAQSAQTARQVVFRLGVVIGDGGVLDKLTLPFTLGLGAVMGSGSQHMPWIAIADVCSAIEQALTDERFRGAINLVAPEATDQRRFSRALARQLHRPLLFRMPDLLVKLLMGEMSVLLLADQQVIPARLRELNFEFQHPHLETALAEAVD